MRFKVGDRVRVREWDDMEEEFGLDRDGGIKCGGGVLRFARGMRKYCGNIYIIAEGNRYYYTLKGCTNYVFTDDMLLPATKFKVGDKVIGNEKANGRYRITRKGWIGEVVYVYGVKGHIEVRGESTDGSIKSYSVHEECFDLYEGEKPSDDTCGDFKVGDRVRHEKGLATIVFYDGSECAPFLLEFDEKIEGGHNGDGRTKAGHGFWADASDIARVDGETKKIVITSDGEKTTARLYEGGKAVKGATAKCSPADEFDFGIGAKIAFERLIESTSKKEEKYYNGKVVCVEKREGFAYTVGKIYEFENGKLVNDNGFQTPETPIKTLEEWNKGRNALFAKFIPLLE